MPEIEATLGRETAELLIVQAGSRIMKAVREGDLVARIARNEFLLLLAGLGERQDATRPASAIARAFVEGMLCGLADAVEALEKSGVEINRVFLVGGAAKNPAVGEIASALFGREVLIPEPGE